MKKGFSFLEVLLVVCVLLVLLVPTALVFHRYQRGMLLENTARQAAAALEMAKNYAVNERREITVRFDDGGFAVYRGPERIGGYCSFPDYVAVREKTAGFDPAVFLPDGAAQQAGYLVIIEEKTKKTRKLILYNVTGKCVVE